MAKKTLSKEVMQVKPSELPKDKSTTVRFNSRVREEIEKLGHTIQSLPDEAIDKKLSKIEVEKKITVEFKKINK